MPSPTYLKGQEWRKSTKERSLAREKDVAEDGYFERCAKDRYGELKAGKTFADAARAFEREYEAITRGRRSPKCVQGHKDRFRLHPLPYFGKKILSDISSGAAHEYRGHRMTEPEPKPTETTSGGEKEPKPWKPPARGEVVMTAAETPFLAAALARGCATQTGLDMQFEQIPAYLEFFSFPAATAEELRAVARFES